MNAKAIATEIKPTAVTLSKPAVQPKVWVTSR
jgi:hypothetical protein